MPFRHNRLPKSPQLTSDSDQQLILINSKTVKIINNRTITSYSCEENIPLCPMCNKVLKKQGTIPKTYYDKPINNCPNIIIVHRKLWHCCKKFQPTPLDPKVLAIVPFSKFTPDAISYIQTRVDELLAMKQTRLHITETLIKELGASANAINKFLKPILSKRIKEQRETIEEYKQSSEQQEYLVLKNKRENSEIPLTKEERSRFRQLRAELSSKYDF